MSKIDFTPTKGMVAEAKKGKEWRKEFGRGGTEVGLKTANMIINNQLTEQRVKKMFAYFERHETYKSAEGFKPGEEGFPSNARIAHALWGGDSGHSWSEKKRNQIENEKEKNMKTKNELSEEELNKLAVDITKRDSHEENEEDEVVEEEEELVEDEDEEEVVEDEEIEEEEEEDDRMGHKDDEEEKGMHDDEEEKDMHDEDEEEAMGDDDEKEEREKVGTLITDGLELPLYKTEEEAKDYAAEMGADPAMCHEHEIDGEIYYMPFEDHEEAHEIMSERMGHEEDEEDERMGHEEDEDDRMGHEDDEKEEKSIWDKTDLTEKRFFNIETRVKTKGKRKIVEGHAAVYGMMSEDLGGFREMIKPGAFDNVLGDDVRAFFNHDPNYLLARTSSGTLKITTDKKGLRYSFDVPDTTAGRDLLVSMERGDITQSSFAFTVEEDSWSNVKGKEVRTIEKVARLYDVSPVSIPAYPDANDLSIAKRSRMIYKDKNKMSEEREYEYRMNLLGLKINILKRK